MVSLTVNTIETTSELDDEPNYEPDSLTKKTTIASQLALIGMSIIVYLAAAGHIVPSHTIWVLLNQYQILMLIPLMGVFVPPDFLYFIQGFDFALLALKWLGIEFLADLSMFGQTLGYEQDSQGMVDIELEDGSMIVNCQWTLLFLVIVFLTHIITISTTHILVYLDIDKQKALKVEKWVNSKLKMQFYVTFILETYMLFAICSISEIYANKEGHAVSLIYSYFMLITLLILTILCTYHYKQHRSNKKSDYRVLYDDKKPTKLSQLSSVIFLLHRLSLTCMCLLTPYVDTRVRTSIFTVVQACMVVYMLVVRPFETWYNNLIECVGSVLLL